MQEDIRSVDTSDSVLDTTWFHEIYTLGQLAPPADIAALVCWLVGPWSRMCKGEFFFAAGAAWMAQVQSDLA